MRVKDFTKKVGSGVTPRGGAEVYQDHGVPLFRSQNVTNEGFLLDDIAYISEEIDESMSGTRVKPNDVLLNITGASIGRCYYTPSDFERGNVNQHVCIIRPTKKVIAPYLYYNLISDNGQRQIDLTQTGSNREGLTKENICNFEFEVPSLDTQHRIVSYLDSHVSSIDKRVSLLTTKRDHYLRLKTAIINRAVTQGLNPDVKMKDSGVLGFERIPSNWTVRRFKEVFRHYSTGITPESKNSSFFEDENKGFTWATIADMNKKWIENSNLNLSDKAVSKFSPILTRKGSLLFSFKLSVGKIAFAGKDMYTNEAIVSILPNSHYCLEFFYYLLPKVLSLNTTENIYGAKMLNQKIIANIQLPLPPLSEQQAIATYLGEKCTKIDAIVENLNQQIEKHKLLKRALINEVITGQRAV